MRQVAVRLNRFSASRKDIAKCYTTTTDTAMDSLTVCVTGLIPEAVAVPRQAKRWFPAQQAWALVGDHAWALVIL